MFQEAAAHARELLGSSGDPQQADFILDRAYFEELSALAKASGSRFLEGYVAALIDGANLRSAVRCARLDKGPDFLRLVLEEVDLRHSRLIGNPLHLKQILMNVIDNAIKYNRPHGSAFVQVKEISCRNGIASYRFVIEDTGIGIGEDFKKHIFEPFTQEHQGARTHYNGVGLGMSIVKKLVEQMKGTIVLDSQIGRGSVVQITLPIRIDGAWSAQPVDEERNLRSNIAGMRVLLVEDNEINCEIVEYILRGAGVEVVTASDGKAAVDAFTAAEPGAFDCVLMDLMMPVMSGYEAARVIRSLERRDAAAVPIIALSANAFDEDIALAKDAGMNEHLAKPVDMHKMFQVMSRLRG